MTDYIKYTIQANDLTEAQAKIICDFDLSSGKRALARNSYKSVIVGFHKGSCFHVSFNN